MSIPAAILDIFAAVMLLVAAISAGRLAAARPWRGGGAAGDADIDGAHLLMGIAMAGMLAPRLTTLPGGPWEAIFAVLILWFGWRVYREAAGPGVRAVARSHHAPHLVHSAAMLYMFAALTTRAGAVPGSGMAGMAGGAGTLRVPTLALAFTLSLAGYAVVDLDQLAIGWLRLRPAPELAPDLALARTAAAAPATAAVAAAAVAAVGGLPADGDGPALTTPVSAMPAAGPDPGRRRAGGLLDPRVTSGCRIAMGVTMALMLAIMI
jgi:hypothetical protein